ncbi:MAG: SDR family oxidoreductase [Nevskia sp.]|nr:SDR family oxidoreductase [Nevskia sp.]
MSLLSGKVAVVTGGGRGIGLSLVRLLAAQGARLVINDLDAEPAEAAAQAVREAGGEAAACVGNVTHADFPKRLLDTALQQFGDVHILVNNAGYVWNSPLHKTTDEQWDAMQDVHLKAQFRILRELHPFLRERVRQETAAGVRVMRKVVNISSVAGTQGMVGAASYCAAKAGVLGMTRALAKEWGKLNVNVNAVAFGFIDTRLTQEIKGETAVPVEGKMYRVGLLREQRDEMLHLIALGRIGRPEEAAGGVMLFCLPYSDYVSGQTLEVDGGLMH